MDGLTTIFSFQNSADALVAQSLVRLAIWAVLGVLGGLGALRQSQHSESVLDAFVTVPVTLGLTVTAILMAVFVDYPAYQTARELQRAYDQRHYQVAEGIVHVTPTQDGWVTAEDIQIGSAHFVLSGNGSALGYHTPAQAGGLLTEGVYARVYYYGDAILRIDAQPPTVIDAQPQSPSHSQVQWEALEPTRPVYWHPLNEPVQLAP